MSEYKKNLAGSTLDWNVHIISWSQYQGPRDRPDTMCFLLNLYDWQSFAIKVDTIEIEEFYPFVTADLSCNSSKFEAFAQDALNLNNSNNLVEDAEGDNSFSTLAKFSKKLIFLTPWYAHVRVRIRG